MFLDLDHFKAINDSLGHGVGDHLIQAVAKRLRETVRETDTVARMGGDEFTVLVSDAKDKEAAIAAATKIIEVFAQPFLAGSHELHTSTSIGVALYPSDGNRRGGAPQARRQRHVPSEGAAAATRSSCSRPTCRYERRPATR